MILGIKIDKNNSGSLCNELIDCLRTKILNGELLNGDRLPSTRFMANELHIARNTVIYAYEQLIAEGYLESRKGSGTYVKLLSDYKLPEKCFEKKLIKNTVPHPIGNAIVFDTGTPDNTMFPVATWSKALKKACQNASVQSFGYSDITGNRNLKNALCQYLYRSKGIKCLAQNILIVSGTSGAITLIADSFEKDSRRIALEDPSIDFVRNIFTYKEYEIYSVPVDDEGMITTKLKQYCKNKPSLIYTVPSHQFPTGTILSASRRMELLKYAVSAGAYIIEDDYDSEFNYSKKIVQPLYNIDSEHTIYIGTFSKTFSPAIRLGYMIVPDNLIERFSEVAEKQNIRTEMITQLAMADLINEKLLDRHIYKMKKIYAKKRQHTISCINKYFKDTATISGDNAGLHLLVSFESIYCEEAKLLEYGVSAEFADDYAVNKLKYKNKLILGYGSLDNNQIEEGIKSLASAFQNQLR